MSIAAKTDEALDQLIIARAALMRMHADVHGGDDRCGSECADYHDAMRAVSWAAEAIGLPVSELHEIAVVHNRERHGFYGELPA
jgi:hypothetical protein